MLFVQTKTSHTPIKQSFAEGPSISNPPPIGPFKFFVSFFLFSLFWSLHQNGEKFLVFIMSPFFFFKPTKEETQTPTTQPTQKTTKTHSFFVTSSSTLFGEKKNPHTHTTRISNTHHITPLQIVTTPPPLIYICMTPPQNPL